MATARTDGLVSSYFSQVTDIEIALQWRNYESLCFPNHRRLDYLFHRLFRRSSKKTSKLRVTGLCEGNPLVAVWFPSRRASNAEMFPFGDVILGNLLLDDICSVVTYTWHGIVLCITCHFRANADLWWFLCCILDKLFNMQLRFRWIKTP